MFDGWTRQAVDSAAARLGVDPVQARLAFPKSQPAMIDCYIQEVDRALEARLHGRAAGGDEDPRADPRPGVAPA